MKAWMMKLEQVEPKQNQTVLIYGLLLRESKKQLTEIFCAYLSQNRVVGDKFEVCS